MIMQPAIVNYDMRVNKAYLQKQEKREAVIGGDAHKDLLRSLTAKVRANLVSLCVALKHMIVQDDLCTFPTIRSLLMHNVQIVRTHRICSMKLKRFIPSRIDTCCNRHKFTG